MKEIETKETDTEEKKQKRTGMTSITSVSVSKEFKKMVEENNISPTEAFRKGVAIELYELGVLGYYNKLNKERSEAIKEFLKKDDLEKLPETLKEFSEIAEKLRLALENL